MSVSRKMMTHFIIGLVVKYMLGVKAERLQGIPLVLSRRLLHCSKIQTYSRLFYVKAWSISLKNFPVKFVSSDTRQIIFSVLRPMTRFIRYLIFHLFLTFIFP